MQASTGALIPDKNLPQSASELPRKKSKLQRKKTSSGTINNANKDKKGYKFGDFTRGALSSVASNKKKKKKEIRVFQEAEALRAASMANIDYEEPKEDVTDTSVNVKGKIKKYDDEDLYYFVEKLMSEDLAEKLTADELKFVDDELLFDYFPLLSGALKFLGMSENSQTETPVFVKLLGTFMKRINANRTLKAKFLLFCCTEEFSNYFHVDLIRQDDCYEAAKRILGRSRTFRERQSTLMKKADGPVQMPDSIAGVSSNTELAKFANNFAFVPGGVPFKDRKYKKKTYKKCFLAPEFIDWVSAVLNCNRVDAVMVGERLRKSDFIERVPNSKKPFVDKPKAHFVVKPNFEVSVSNISGGQGYTTVELKVPVDLLDLQTNHFLSHTIDEAVLVEKKTLGLIEIQHPLRIDWKTDETLVSHVRVEKIFSSIAAPAMLSLKHLPEGGSVGDDSAYIEALPRIIEKKGDNLYQDLGCQITFKCLNVIWATSREIFPDPTKVPRIYTYEVFPTGVNQGFMEVVSNVVPFKDFNWDIWKISKGRANVDNIINTAAGAYIGGYIVGVRDRHWDNILIKNDDTLFHIDFGFLLGTQPPIDAPKFSISEEMTNVLKEMGKWEEFLERCANAFIALRRRSSEVIRVCSLVFGSFGWDPKKVSEYVGSPKSLMLDSTDEEAKETVYKLLQNSANSWSNLFKQFSHKKIDPLWYGLLDKHFTPAEYIMKKVESADAKKQAAAKVTTTEKGAHLVLQS
eukprot:CAMPEP_0174261406 /NCGR_PEP_ID=MMETSP0439-20130205/11412_1 /TAXON_ID=0 /ORGANISM="Stereomyxa ramosa, Strain Chinc5" /LENGTH=744 /DNA_ID=CAMNT_0015345877 /DNA_START=28 /DNA_END=2262 /DNA_ORIENTATION=+